MKNALFMSCAILIAAVGLSACAEQRAENLPPGTYKSRSMTVDSAGTKREKKSSTKVTVDDNGDRTVEMENESSTDPKGLFNKSTTKSKTVIESDHD